MAGKKKKLKQVCEQKKDSTIKVKADPAKRKMPPEELKAYLRESRRGTGIHGQESNKEKRRKAKQELKKEKISSDQ